MVREGSGNYSCNYLLAVILCLTIVVRLVFCRHIFIESDEAIVGLMGKHILEKGETPVFYYGQHYLGALEAYLVALAFALFGINVFSMRLVTITASVLFVLTLYWLARRLLSGKAALYSALLAAVPPVQFVLWSVKVRGGFIEPLVLGNTILFLAAREKVSYALIGFVAGLAFWTSQLVVPYLAAVFVMLVMRRESSPSLLLGVPAFFAGSFPLWHYNLKHGGATLSTLWDRLREGPEGPVLQGIVFQLFGTEEPWILGAGSVVIGTVAIISFIAGPARQRDLWFIPVFILSALSVVWKTLHDFRYVFSLYTVIPLVLGAFISKLNKKAAIVCLIFLLATNLVSLSTFPRYYPNSEDRTKLRNFLRHHNLIYIWADYWIAYALTFETDEQIIAAPVFSDRYPPYSRMVREADASRVAYVFYIERDMMDRSQEGYVSTIIGQYVVYYAAKQDCEQRAN